MSTLSRRDFLKMSGLTAAFIALAACKPTAAQTLIGTMPIINPSPSPLPSLLSAAPSTTAAPLTTITNDAELPLLLQRITFGLQTDELSHAAQLGFDQTIDEQLDFARINDADIEPHLSSLSTLSMAPSDLLTVTPKYKPISELTQAALARAVYSKRQLYELMVDFWTNHFNIYAGKGNDVYLKPLDDQAVIRKYALGNFSDLLSASAHSPAMLVYLDNDVSTKNQPNENYARELMELHTLSVDGGYTQQDVADVARALTGWSTGGFGKNFGKFIFNSANHDNAPKTILGVTFPAGQGIQDGEKVIDILAHHPSTARFISTKLARRFVADDPPAGLIDQAASTFTQSGGDIASVMRVILHSAEFRASLGQKIKRPFEWIVSALRSVNANIHPENPLISALGLLGQPLYRWPAPDGFPDTAAAWTSTTGLLNRWNLSLAIAFNTLSDSHVDFAGMASSQSTPEATVDLLSRQILGLPLPVAAAQVVTDYYRSASVQAGLPGVAALLLASPFFQYR
jgi:uncharacterized protein (DUF1800 family)